MHQSPGILLFTQKLKTNQNVALSFSQFRAVSIPTQGAGRLATDQTNSQVKESGKIIPKITMIISNNPTPPDIKHPPETMV